MEVAIEARQLTKTFQPPSGWRRVSSRPGIRAVKDVDLTVHTGGLFGLLGPNGAGKTTLVKVLCTLIAPTSGQAKVAGYPLAESAKIRGAVGLVVSDERSFYWRLTGWRNLEFFAAMYGLRGTEAEERIQAVLADVDMLGQADTPFRNYSTGMKQRLAIARSLLHKPRILFLDEPSRSLDPNATSRLHELIQQLLARQGVTVFLITHDLSEAEKLCHQVAVMHRGQIRVMGEPGELRRQLRPQQHYSLRVGALSADAEQAIALLVPDLRHERANGYAFLFFQAGESDGSLTAVLDCLRQHQVEVHSIDGHPPSLEEVFSHYTGGS